MYVFLLEYKKVQSANNNNYYDFNDITAQSFQNHFKDKFSCNVKLKILLFQIQDDSLECYDNTVFAEYIVKK